MNVYFKKTISPVVAVALLLIVTVVAVVGFQNWFFDFSSNIFSNVEISNGEAVEGTLEIDKIIGNTLYVMNNFEDNLRVEELTIGDKVCVVYDDLKLGMNVIDVFDCVDSIEIVTPDIVLVTDKKIVEKKVFLSDEDLSSTERNIGFKSGLAFNSTWDTRLVSANSTGSNLIGLPLESSGVYNFIVYWGDGSNSSITSWNQPEVNHTYVYEGVYNISIVGTIRGFRFNRLGDMLKILDISNWGVLNVGNNGKYFAGCGNLEVSAIDNLDLTGTTSLVGMFWEASKFNSDISGWDVSKVNDMTIMFSDASSFNQDLNDWDVSSVREIGWMFANAVSFNGNISEWDVTGVTSFYGLFYGAKSFNSDINSWDVSNLNSLVSTFEGASSFNQDLDSWDLGNLELIHWVFYNATSFNGNVSNWDVTGVNSIYNVFSYATSFNSDISSWDVSNAKVLENMFNGATSFNINISGWDVHNITNMKRMFKNAKAFNQDLSSWNVSKIVVDKRIEFDVGADSWVLDRPVWS